MLKVMILEESRVQVTHEIIGGASGMVTVTMLNGTISDLELYDENGNDVRYTTDGSVITLEAPRDVTIRYHLEDAIQYEDGYWRWDLRHMETIMIYPPDGMEVIHINGRPVYVLGSSLNCHGCNMTLEYALDEPRITEHIVWEDHKFELEIMTFSQVYSLSFDQPSKSIGFDVEGGRYVIVVIPLELLWEPYTVLLDGEVIPRYEFFGDEENVWVGFKPSSSGRVHIVGTSVVPEFSGIAPAIGIAMAVAVAASITVQTRRGLTPR